MKRAIPPAAAAALAVALIPGESGPSETRQARDLADKALEPSPGPVRSLASAGDDGWRRVVSTTPATRRHARKVFVQGYRAHGFPSWWLRGALCVHRGEGSWYANTGNGFYGGMQFAASTWSSNGGLRFAHHAHLATPHQQLLVAYWLWRRAGWHPWPTTARRCGLL